MTDVSTHSDIGSSDVLGRCVIDPDYARIFTKARIVAWQYGYACLLHGSLTRDLDLLLVPWTEKATHELDALIGRLAKITGLEIQGPSSDKPHGRKSWTLIFPAHNDVRWVDISVFGAPMISDQNIERGPA